MWILEVYLVNMILVYVLNVCMSAKKHVCFFKCLYLNKDVRLSLSVYYIFTTYCLKVNIFSWFHLYLLNEMMIRQIMFSLPTGTILIMRNALLIVSLQHL